MTSKTSDELPSVPSKRYFTIGEVSELCDVKPHVLRYWEHEFSMLKPVKRRGNRRYYQQQDIIIVRTIRRLLYEEGYTISGARAQLVASGQKQQRQKDAELHHHSSITLKEVISDLEDIINTLK